MSTFKERVLNVIKHIPKGNVMTYGEVARYAGVKNGSRALGNIVSKNQSKDIPCHRVIQSDGSVGEYNGIATGIASPTSKYALLKKEGVTFTQKGKVIFK